MIESLLHFLKLQSFYAAFLFLLVFGMTRPLRKYSALWHLGLWSLVLVRLILPPQLSAPFGLGNAANWLKSSLVNDHLSWLPIIDVRPFMLPQADPYHSSLTLNGSPATDSAAIWFGIWILGLVMMTWFYCNKVRSYRAVTQNARPLRRQDLLEICNSWRKHFKIRRSVCLLTSEYYLSPFTNGVLRPKIYLPDRLVAGADKSTLESVIAHEMAHIHRWDALWLLGQNLLQIIYFFHPLIWITNKLVNQARERRCDEMVVATQKIAPEIYGRSLLNVLNMKLIGRPQWPIYAGLSGRSDLFKVRIETIKGGSPMKKSTKLYSFSVLSLLAAFVLPMSPVSEAPDNYLVKSFDSILFRSDGQPVTFAIPIKSGYISARFDSIIHPMTGEKILHKGIDIAARRGVDVFACAAGKVRIAKSQESGLGGYGNYVVIDHGDGLQSLYAHLSEYTVEAGQSVSKGELLGKVGNTGVSSGPHLHFEIRRSQVSQDPEELMSFDGLEE